MLLIGPGGIEILKKFRVEKNLMQLLIGPGGIEICNLLL